LVYDQQIENNQSGMAKSRKQVQPRSGPEKAFGEALREIRRGKGISQMDLYSASGIDRTYISAVERGIQSPTIRMIVRFAKYLSIRPSEMVRRMERSKFYSDRSL
jgi:transcriptional regulator with XRE-family HTH domain